MENIPFDLMNYVDVESALNKMNSINGYKRMLKLFLESDEIDILVENYKNKDYAHMAFNIHSIKGITGNLSLKAIYELTIEIEKNIKNKDLSEENFNRYKMIWFKTMGYIKIYIDSM